MDAVAGPAVSWVKRTGTAPCPTSARRSVPEASLARMLVLSTSVGGAASQTDAVPLCLGRVVVGRFPPSGAAAHP